MGIKLTYHFAGKLTDGERKTVSRFEAAFYSDELLGLDCGVFRVVSITQSIMPTKYDIELIELT